MDRFINVSSGYLEVVTGPMFSGKTSELQRRLRLAKIAGKKVKAFRYMKDERYGVDMHTHDSVGLEAVPFRDIFDVLNAIDDAEIVGIDEVQFALMEGGFSTATEYKLKCEEVVAILQEKTAKGTTFICAGLPTNFRGEPFNEFMKVLLGHADIIDTFSAICTYYNEGRQCSGLATRTQRIVNGQPAAYNDPLTLIGAKESYEARCPSHHFVPKGISNSLF